MHARGGTSHGNYCCVNCIATLLEAVLFNVVAFLTFTICVFSLISDSVLILGEQTTGLGSHISA